MLLKVANHREHYYEILDFINMVGFIIEAYNNRLTPEEKRDKEILYAAQYNDVVLDETARDEATIRSRPQNIVVHSIMRRESGTLGRDPYSSPREVRARRREEIPITNTDGSKEVITIFGKLFDNTVRFECFAPTAVQTHDLILRMEEMLEVHAPWLETLGFIRVLYSGRSVPSFNTKTLYHAMAFQMYVRTEHLWYRSDKTVNDIQMEVSTGYQALVDMSSDE